MKIVFAGTPDFAKQHLEMVLDSKHEIIGVLTQPDRRSGRGKKLQSSAVKDLAKSLTALDCNFLPLPDLLSGWVKTPIISCFESSTISKCCLAKSGVPAKTIFID